MAALIDERGPMFKVVLLGEAGVGKTSLFYRIKENTFISNGRNTIGVDSCSKFLKVNDKQVTLSVWDTAGVERFRTVTKNYYRGAHACILMFGIDEPGSLQYLTHWTRDANEFCPDAFKFVVANKIDLDCRVSLESMQMFSDSHNCSNVFQISAKTGEGIDGLLDSMAKELLNENKETRLEKEKDLSSSGNISVGETPDPTVRQWKSGCCKSM
ncbi:ras-related protein Rab-1C-like [Actinia tenebrosa]|uniref:Ras-related protein Rab-1C-like n=1 Tax=Actinia tenebrosa TaxID=6105 RepID=A0A6P8IGH6_ACTTE|nr:ras-related protein Rab-1C-like [Actinia tenebrosa]